MFFPTQADMDRAANTLPGDEIFPKVKHHLEAINTKEPEIRKKIKDLIIDDMTFDLALARAVEDVSPVVEYLCRDREHNPDFTAEALFRTFSRISRFKASREFMRILEIPEDLQGLLIRAEIDRLWAETGNRKQVVIGQPTTHNRAFEGASMDAVKQEILAAIREKK